MIIDLVTLYPQLESAIAFKIEALTGMSADELGPRCDDLSVFFRTAGIGALLIDLDTDQFYHMLIRSGLTRVFLLQKTAPEDREDDRYCKLTRANGFFDAVAAGRFDIAAQIAALSPKGLAHRYEYEDDYCYVRFLQLTINGEDDDIRREILGRLADALEGEASARYDVCQALIAHDADAFDEAVIHLLDDWAEVIEFQRGSVARNDVAFAAAQYIFVEGLALLRIAEASSLQTRPEYPYCPREARLPMVASFPHTLYPRA